MNLTTFNFKQVNVRTVTDEQGNPWFIAADVCAVLEIGNVTMAMKRLDDDEQALISIEGLNRGNVPTNTVNESGLYSLILTSRKPEAKNFKKWVTSEVLPSIRKTGSYSVPKQQQQPEKISFNEAAAGLEIIYRSLNVSESGKLGLFRGLAEDYGVNPNRLPAYAIDAPAATVTAGSSETTASLTEILKLTNTPLSAAVANRKLHELGLLKQNSRKSSNGQYKKFWSVTEEGLKYGKNVTSDLNPRETQPHWYVNTMQELVNLLK